MFFPWCDQDTPSQTVYLFTAGTGLEKERTAWGRGQGGVPEKMPTQVPTPVPGRGGGRGGGHV